VPKSKGHRTRRLPDYSRRQQTQLRWRQLHAGKRSLLFPQADEINEVLDLVQALLRKGSDLLDQKICFGRHSGGSLSIVTLFIQ
jgi:hypothetical protein